MSSNEYFSVSILALEKRSEFSFEEQLRRETALLGGMEL
jgi:hypothetical protein